jgi:hypothetical protein
MILYETSNLFVKIEEVRTTSGALQSDMIESTDTFLSLADPSDILVVFEEFARNVVACQD